ncbi:copper resistance protein B [Alteromonas sp. 14N.309.X.WAT.G.H12]|uniref:copper resistance protein B n=1 Tax=Alteromonas sp. 14N.309.X.WAT.G.H12 TaxID=3120824 RepID=UPI002FD107A0
MIKVWLICACGFFCTPAIADPSQWPAPMEETYLGQLMVDQLEVNRYNGQSSINWDLTGWYGGDYHRVVLRSEGENVLNDAQGSDLERNDLSYSYLFAPFWSLQAGLGIRQSMSTNQREHYGVLGITGLAPYWFEVDSNVIVNETGQLQWLNEVEYELLLTQTSYLQPRITANVNLSDSHRFNRQRGLEKLRIGLRYRVEITREFAPYIGMYWQKERETDTSYTTESGVIAGVRMWF